MPVLSKFLVKKNEVFKTFKNYFPIQLGLAFMSSSLTSHLTSSTTVSFSMFIMGTLTQVIRIRTFHFQDRGVTCCPSKTKKISFFIFFVLQLVTIFGFPYSRNISKMCQIIWSFFPPNLLAKALFLLIKASSSSQDYAFLLTKPANCVSNNISFDIITIICELLSE